jgi:hypothetical protein
MLQYIIFDHKNPMIYGRNHHKGNKTGRPKKGQKTHSLQEQKKKEREN